MPRVSKFVTLSASEQRSTTRVVSCLLVQSIWVTIAMSFSWLKYPKKAMVSNKTWAWNPLL